MLWAAYFDDELSASATGLGRVNGLRVSPCCRATPCFSPFPPSQLSPHESSSTSTLARPVGSAAGLAARRRSRRTLAHFPPLPPPHFELLSSSHPPSPPAKAATTSPPLSARPPSHSTRRRPPFTILTTPLSARLALSLSKDVVPSPSSRGSPLPAKRHAPRPPQRLRTSASTFSATLAPPPSPIAASAPPPLLRPTPSPRPTPRAIRTIPGLPPHLRLTAFQAPTSPSAVWRSRPLHSTSASTPHDARHPSRSLNPSRGSRRRG